MQFILVMNLLSLNIAYSGIIFRKIQYYQSLSCTVRSRSISMKETTDSSSVWYSKGLNFSCQMCGNCCSGSSGSVRFTDKEADDMSNQLQIPKEQFYEQYTRRRGRGRNSYYELKETRNKLVTFDGISGYDCVFLDRNSMPGKAICSLYCKTTSMPYVAILA